MHTQNRIAKHPAQNSPTLTKGLRFLQFSSFSFFSHKKTSMSYGGGSYVPPHLRGMPLGGPAMPPMGPGPAAVGGFGAPAMGAFGGAPAMGAAAFGGAPPAAGCGGAGGSFGGYGGGGECVLGHACVPRQSEDVQGEEGRSDTPYTHAHTHAHARAHTTLNTTPTHRPWLWWPWWRWLQGRRGLQGRQRKRGLQRRGLGRSARRVWRVSAHAWEQSPWPFV